MPSPLDISTKYYFWKPYMAYFEAFELKAYQGHVSFPDGLILDLGCGDGTFAQMLKELLGFERHVIGVDFDLKRLCAAQRKSVYSQVFRVNIIELPFKEESFDAVFANQVLYYVRPNPGQAIAEIRRILKKGGKLICTVPIDSADQHYYLTGILKGIGLTLLGQWHRQRMNIRFFGNGYLSSFSLGGWIKMLKECGLSIQKVIPYISAAISRRWSILTLTPFRAMSILKIIPSKQVHRLASIIQKQMMRSYKHLSISTLPEYGDFILIISEKPDNGTNEDDSKQAKRL
ncbi:MAG: class I SAM-dependent methyltransferase [Nitrospirota bacterium]